MTIWNGNVFEWQAFLRMETFWNGNFFNKFIFDSLANIYAAVICLSKLILISKNPFHKLLKTCNKHCNELELLAYQ